MFEIFAFWDEFLLRDIESWLFCTYETESVLFVEVLENSVLPMSWDSPQATFKVTSEVLIMWRLHEYIGWRSGQVVVFAMYEEMTNDK